MKSIKSKKGWEKEEDNVLVQQSLPYILKVIHV